MSSKQGSLYYFLQLRVHRHDLQGESVIRSRQKARIHDSSPVRAVPSGLARLEVGAEDEHAARDKDSESEPREGPGPNALP